MRKVTQQAVAAFLAKRTGRFGNTTVEFSALANCYVLKLHNNVIARSRESGGFEISNAGWTSNTTKERLNGLPGVNIHQKNFQWFLNSRPWDGSWTLINAREEELRKELEAAHAQFIEDGNTPVDFDQWAEENAPKKAKELRALTNA